VKVVPGNEVGHRRGVLVARVELQVPGQAIVTFGENEDVRAAVREAFHHAARQLQEYAQRLRGGVRRQQSAA
jgi:ribosome-associated translation inhibitor RaiA